MRYIICILLLAVWSHVSAQIPDTQIPDAQTSANRDADANGPDLVLNPGPDGRLNEDEPLDEVAALKYSQDAIGRGLDGYTLYDRRGRAVMLTDYQGKPLIISMIYTSCYHICPTTTQNLARAIKLARSAVGGADAFNIVTIGFDVRKDTPERMRSFARQRGVGSERNWDFLSTSKAAIKHLTANLGFIFVPSSSGFEHLNQLTVVAADGKIFRQIYGMDFDPGFLVGAMQELILGSPGESLSLSALVNRVRLYCTKYDPSTGTYRFNYSMIFAASIGAVIFLALSVVVARVVRNSFRPGTS